MPAFQPGPFQLGNAQPGQMQLGNGIGSSVAPAPGGQGSENVGSGYYWTDLLLQAAAASGE